MSPQSNAGRPFLWPAVNAVALVVAGLAAVMIVGAAPARARNAGRQAIDAPRLDWSHARQAYRLVEQQVAAALLEPDEPVQPIRVRDLAGAKVTLRRFGATLGRGELTEAQIQMTDAGVADLVPVIRQATTRALLKAEQTLFDQHRKAVTAAEAEGRPVPEPKTLEQIGPRLLVDLQLARAPEPIRLPPGKGLQWLYGQFAPGFHGLRLRNGNATEDGRVNELWLWPANALATNLSPASQLLQLPTLLGLPIDDLEKIGQSGGPVLSRFEVIHIVRPSPDAPPVQLVRGNQLLPPTTLDSPTLNAMADRLAAYLIRRQRANGEMAGPHRPTSGRNDPATASIDDTALAAYALARRARYLTALDADRRDTILARQAATRACDYLTKALLAGHAPDRPVAMALGIMALVESPHLADRKAQRDELARRLLAMQGDDGLFRRATDNDRADAEDIDIDTDAPPTEQAFRLPTQVIIYAALASLFDQTRDAAIGVAARRAQAAIWPDLDPNRIAGLLYWLMLAESRMRHLAEAIDDVGPEADEPVVAPWPMRARQMHALASALLKRQVASPPDLGPPDVVGGFDLTPSKPVGSAGPPNPDWRSAQVLAFLAVTLREPGMVEADERLMWTLRCGLAARFLAQLMFDEPGCFYVRSRDDTLGGLRLALFNNTLAVAPNAQALLAVTELQETLAALPPPADPANH